MRFTALFVLAASVTSIFADVGQVVDDITKRIGPQWNTLHHHVKSFLHSGFTGAYLIYDDFKTLIADTNTAITNVQNAGSFNLFSGVTIVEDLRPHVPTFLATLANIGTQAPSWSGIPGGPAQVLSDLRRLNTSTLNFLDAITSAEFYLFQAECENLKAQTSGAFTTAIAAYSVG